MFAFLEKDTFPWWYTLVKWGIPLGLAASTGVGAGLMLTGTVGMPAFFGMLKWAPAFFSSLEGFSAIAVLGLTSTVLASTVGVVSSFILRGSILFPLTEAIATNSQHSKESMSKEHLTLTQALEEKLAKTGNALQQTDAKLASITTQYDHLRGAFDEREAHEKSRLKASIDKNAAAANQGLIPTAPATVTQAPTAKRVNP